MSERDDQGRFEAIDPDECRALLAGLDVGRVGIESDEGPTIFPVNYRVRGDDLVIRTSPTGLLARAGRGLRVAFQVDQLDLETQTGWTVLVRGRLGAAIDATDAGWLWSQHPPVPWAGPDRAVLIGIDMEELSGRVVSSRLPRA